MITPDDNLTTFERTRRALHRAVDRICDAWPQALVDADCRGFSSGGEKVGGRGSDVPDPTSSAALCPDHAVGWLAELHDVAVEVLEQAGLRWSVPWEARYSCGQLHDAVERICCDWTVEDLIDVDPRSSNYGRDVFGLERLADDAARWWPPTPKTGQQVAGLTVGTEDVVEDCGLCGGPTQAGRNRDGQLLRRRIDGQAFHAVAGYGHGACWWTVWRQRRGTVAA